MTPVEIEIAPGVFAKVTRLLDGPNGGRVLLRELPRDDLGDTLPSGLVLPQQSEDHQRLLQGEILTVSEGVDDPLSLVPGLRVICGRWSRVPLDTEGRVWVCSEEDIQAIISGV